MKNRPLFLFSATALLTLFTASALRAQNLYVGSNSSSVSTNFTSGTNSYSATYIGFDVGANSNSLSVENTDTVLTNSGVLRVGEYGSGNRMVISNGGKVQNTGGHIGSASTASNNSVLVTGTNSLWTNSGAFTGLAVGENGSGNSLVISNGGMVQNTGAYIGRESTASNNSVLVTGTNSLWTNSGALIVANSGAGNSLIISNGGTVQNAVGAIGSSSTASNNSVVVTGTGSLWSNSSSFYVGNRGAGNSMVISNGGKVRITADEGTIGSASTASNNSVLVTGTNSLWTNSGAIYVGESGSGSSLVISNGGMVQNGSGLIGSSSTASNNSVLVTGAGSTWSNTDRLTVGRSGSGTLTVSDGGNVAATNILIGRNTSSAGTLNIGRFGTNDSAGTISAPTIAFGNSTNERAINFNQSNSTTVSAAISGNGTVNQLGSGTTILSASNTYTGTTTVAAGKLAVDGSIAGSTVTVNSGGTLAGSGSVGGLIVTTGGTISPGSSPGNLTVANNMLWNGGGNYNWQVLGTTDTPGYVAGTTWDLLTVTGALDLTALTPSSKFNINLWSLGSTGPDVNGDIDNFNPTTGYEWLVVAAGSINGFDANEFNVNHLATNGTGGFSNTLDGSYVFGVRQDGGNLYVTYGSAAPIPEPGTWAAMVIFAGGAAYAGWRRRKSAKVA